MRLNAALRAKPTVINLPTPSGSASVPGMITAPAITRNGNTCTFVAGSYSGATGVTKAYLLNGVNVAGRVSGGAITLASGDAGKLLAFRETITGSGGSITRQASIIV